MNIEEALRDAKIDYVDGEVLMAHVLTKDRSWVIAHPEHVLTCEQELQFKTMLKRRREGEPVAYIVGEKEFYGRRFKVDPRVLIPRPSTEGLIEMVLKKSETRNSKSETNSKFENPIIKTLDAGIVGVFIPNEAKEANAANEAILVDIGTGSGCIAIALACELLNFSLSRGERVRERGWKNIQSLKNPRNYLTPSPGPSPQGGGTISNMRIIATDISTDALDIAKENAKRHGVSDRIEFREGSLLEPIMGLSEPFIIVSNPPYLSSEASEANEANEPNEPNIALFAGPTGTDVLIPLREQAKEHPYCRGIFFECQEGQLDSLSL